MSDKVGVAVVGAGFVGGQAHIPSFKKIEGSDLIALGARTEKHVKPLAEQYGVKYYLDYDKLLEDPKIQAVVLAVPTPMHFDLSMKAMKKGKHVLCEMPLAPTIDRVKELQKTAENNKVILMPILQFRFAPIYTKTKEMIESGMIGKSVAFHFREFIPASSLAEQWPAGSWAWNIEKSGGYPDFTLSVWSLDMFRWLFKSEIENVQWMASYPKLEKYGGILGYNTMGVIKISNGAVGSLHYGASVTPSAALSRLEVYGDNTDVIHAINFNKILLYGSGEQPQEWNLDVKGTRVWGHRQLDEHFIDCILHHKKPQVTAEDAIKAEEVALKIVKSMK
ncbi:MAG TPA: Gfo/Idh/MocA family oxidoreductase [candidate division Zixibacteria bacterium]|nr:Gfo/Idh/MocA family oxidoreductase [candidate division Zixibacteria bacterium]